MRGTGASTGEMPGFPFPGRPGREPDEPPLDMLLTRRPVFPGVAAYGGGTARQPGRTGGPRGSERGGGGAVDFARAAAPPDWRIITPAGRHTQQSRLIGMRLCI
jgi:hypothetical protein